MALRQSTACLMRTTTRVLVHGDGAGKSGGTGGSIRDAGGAFGKMEAAREGEYFHKLQQKQIDELKKHLSETVAQTEAQLKQHQEALNRHKKALADLEKAGKK
ncbi:unnamed protein product, partial [Mesorhabditis spiculigera]